MTVAVKTNIWLWLLTGRSMGFANPLFNTGVNYGSPQSDDDIREGRELLCLDDTRTDFHVLAALAAALEIASVLRILPDEHSTVFHPQLRHAPGGVEITGATFLPPDGRRWPTVRNMPKSIPASLRFDFVRDGAVVRISDDLGRMIGAVGWAGAANVLRIDNLAEITGIDAQFNVPDWDGAGTFSVTAPPMRYPYEAVAGTITSPTLLHLMSVTGTLGIFSTTMDPVRKVGSLACAIMLAQYKRHLMQPTVPVSIDSASVARPLWETDSYHLQLHSSGNPVFLDADPVTYDNDQYVAP